MTSEQLQQTRAEHWRQNSNPLLTAEEAREWLTSVGFCLYLPRRAQIAAPAPSFVEAVMGAATDAPTRETVEQATVLLRRLAVDGACIPLNLLGATGAMGGSDVPDFLCSRETLPYIFSLIGGRNWKSGPGAKASPLMTEIWTLLGDGGSARTAQEIQIALGHELTEAAVLRALMELWNGLRVIPVYGEDATRWELTQARFAVGMGASQKIAQTTSLSALVSLHLESAVAVSTAEIESFLSPLAARSRVREVVNGLQATRQLGLVSVAAQPLLHVAGSLPEFAEEPAAAATTAETLPESEASAGSASDVEAQNGATQRVEPEFPARERKPFERKAGKSFPRGVRKPYPHRERFAARDRDERREPERDGVRRRPFEKKPFERGRGKFGKKPFGAQGGERGGERRPPYAGRDERPQRGGRSFGGKRSFGAKRPFFRDRDEKPEGRRSREFGSGFSTPHRGGDRPDWHEGGRSARREGGWKAKGGFDKGRSAKDGKFGFKRGGERYFQGQQRPESRREGGPEFRRSGRPRPDREGGGEFRNPSFSGERKQFEKPGKPFAKFAKFTERPSKPYGKPGKSVGKFTKGSDRGPKPFGKSGGPFDKDGPRFGEAGFDKRGFGRSNYGKRRFGKSGKPGFGARKPGGFKPSVRKHKSEEHGDAE